ncbi:MAG: hypothetical protein AB8B91_04560 [Rubripirellula sp.]
MTAIRFLSLLAILGISFPAISLAQENPFSIPQTLDRQGNTLSSMIRERSGELGANRSSQELGDQDSTDSLRELLDSEPLAKPNRDSETTDRADEDGATDESEEEGTGEDSEEDQALARSRSTMSHLQRLRKPIGQIHLTSTRQNDEGAGVPENKASGYFSETPLVMISAIGNGPQLPQRYTIGFSHRPLYYEQRNLERCGKGRGYFQNAISGIQFLANTMCLPYHMGRQRPDCSIASPGDCLTCHEYPVDWNPLPVNLRGTLAESAAIAGFTFLLL